LWVDVTYPYIAGSSLHATAMKSPQLRYMLASDLSAAALTRIFGSDMLDSLYAQQSAFEALIARSAGHNVRVTTALGTDVTFKLAQSLGASPRRASSPGLYFLPGSCLLNPDIESVRGRIVLETVFHEYYTSLRTPIELEVDGRIRAVRGGGTERPVLERALLRAGGGQYGYIIHFAHGIHSNARFTGDCFVEDMRAPGSNAIGMGLPFWLPDGGENHPDGVISMQSVWLDGELIVADGCTNIPSGAVPRAARLETKPLRETT
jgi:leucyl aminopeptidase (aminopeptidase T)